MSSVLHVVIIRPSVDQDSFLLPCSCYITLFITRQVSVFRISVCRCFSRCAFIPHIQWSESWYPASLWSSAGRTGGVDVDDVWTLVCRSQRLTGRSDVCRRQETVWQVTRLNLWDKMFSLCSLWLLLPEFLTPPSQSKLWDLPSSVHTSSTFTPSVHPEELQSEAAAADRGRISALIQSTWLHFFSSCTFCLKRPQVKTSSYRKEN